MECTSGTLLSVTRAQAHGGNQGSNPPRHPPTPYDTSPPVYPSAPCPSSLLHLHDTPVSSNTIMSHSHFNFCTSQLKPEQRQRGRILLYPPLAIAAATQPPPISYLQNNLSNPPHSEHTCTAAHVRIPEFTKMAA